MAENQPTDPGTQPTLVIDPADGQNVEAPTFTFPLGLKSSKESGPFGPRPQDFDRKAGFPWLGQQGPIGPVQLKSVNFRTLATGGPTIQRVDIDRPSILFPLDPKPTPNALASHASLWALPSSTAPFTIAGISAVSGVLFLPSPGEWYMLSASGFNADWEVPYGLMPCEDRTVAENWMQGRDNAQTWGNQNDAALGAAVTVRVLVLETALGCTAVNIQNTGPTNDLRFSVGGASLSNTRGWRLQPGESYLMTGVTWNPAIVEARSQLGTSCGITFLRRTNTL